MLDDRSKIPQVNYILGIGRSGSTLLTTILNSHSQIKAIPEIPLTIFFANQYHKVNASNKNLNSQVIQYLELMQLIRPKTIVNLHAEKLRKNQIKYSSYTSFITLVFSFFQINGKSGSTPLVVDKNPYYSFHYIRLRKLTPNAKFIILVRDYRANVLSRKSKKLDKSPNVIFNAFRWRIFHAKINKYKNNRDCLIIRYEDLVAKPEKVLSLICDFFEITYEEEILTEGQLESMDIKVGRKSIEKFAKNHFQGLTQPINESRVNAWQHELSEEEISACETICGKYGEDFGYKKFKSTNVSQTYLGLIVRNLKWYSLAVLSIYKEYLIYYLPASVKLKRIRQKSKKR